MNCYKCGVSIDASNQSQEHIIPNAFGGRLRSSGLLCSTCNSDFGEKLDADLSKSTPLATLLNVSRDRGTPPKVKGKTKKGKELMIDEKLTPSNVRQIFEPTSDGKHRYVFRSEKEARKLLKRKGYSKNKIDETIKKIKWKKEYIKDPVYFDDVIHDLSALKGIIKIAINYFIHAGGDRKWIQHLFTFLDRAHNVMHNNYIKYDYINAYEGKVGEIMHVIHLKADPKEKMVYCIIELFSVHRFIVVLNYMYLGDKIEAKYAIELISSKETTVNEIPSISRETVMNLDFNTLLDNPNGLINRLCQVYDLKGITYVKN